ncbi:ribosomal-protein-alanine N-acetyltransferase [Albidovulum inexpectatum]|uniref:[Ribosomal protein bS18]-alanine N-acetyltransferase n=1 Tax=Albidovulum inexpectatum TaxID=196587 RepID=A0A2S5JGV6_9RHOB|nr:ribosomal protein S18-alanine N-acetyltransferase [Albidovulum inexpectatum]PPB80588.1 ribosomal-protein-alanine N-acetyltransferase [Albidovulum inexpectatum]
MTDAWALAALHAAVFTTPRPWSADEFAAFLGQPGAFILSRQDDAGLGGLLVGRVVADEAELLTLAVAPERQRQGHGAALVRSFLDEARRRGAATAFLEVAADNLPAIALYRRFEFAESGCRRGYYRRPDGSPVDALVMARNLRRQD